MWLLYMAELPPNVVTHSRGEHPKRQLDPEAASPSLTQPWKTHSINFTTFSSSEPVAKGSPYSREEEFGATFLMGGYQGTNLHTCFKSTTVQLPLTGLSVFKSAVYLPAASQSLKELELGVQSPEQEAFSFKRARIPKPCMERAGPSRFNHPPLYETEVTELHVC